MEVEETRLKNNLRLKQELQSNQRQAIIQKLTIESDRVIYKAKEQFRQERAAIERELIESQLASERKEKARLEKLKVI